MKQQEIEDLQLQSLRQKANEPIPKSTWLILILFVAMAAFMVWQNIQIKELTNDKKIEKNKTEIKNANKASVTAKTKYDSVDNGAGEIIHSKAKKAAKRIIYAQKEKQSLTINADTLEMAEKIWNYGK